MMPLYRLFPILLMSTLLLAGCQHGPNASDDLPDFPANSAPVETNSFQIEATENFTALIPFHATSELTISDAEILLTGPMWKGYTLLHIGEIPTQARYFGAFNEMQERAESYKENKWLGQREVTCLDETAQPPCPLSSASQQNATTYSVYVGDVVPAGFGYFLLSARFEDRFLLNVTFDKPLRVGDPIFQASASAILTWDQFSSEFADVRHCGTVYACGVLLNGRHPLALSSYTHVHASFTGRFDAGGAALSLCIEDSEGDLPDCSANTTPLLNQVYVTMGRILPGENSARWLVSAYGPGPDDIGLASFMFYSELIGFNLPSGHPLR